MGDGNTRDDIVIVDSQTVKVRAERAANGDGRVYTIEFAVTDASGNRREAQCRAVVPHDRADAAAAGSGLR